MVVVMLVMQGVRMMTMVVIIYDLLGDDDVHEDHCGMVMILVVVLIGWVVIYE